MNKQFRSITHNEIDNDPFLEELKPDLEISLFSLDDSETEEYDPEDDESYYLYYISNRKLRKYIAYRIAHICNYIFANDDFADFTDFTDYGRHTFLFIAATIPLRNYVMGIIKRRLNRIYESRRITFKFTTLDEFKKYGFYNTPWKIMAV